MIELKGAGGAPTPSLIESVRRSTDPFVAASSSLIIDVALGTLRAERLGKTQRWLAVHRQMAEQCTHPRIAAHHAVPFTGREHVLEICTGADSTQQLLQRYQAGSHHLKQIRSSPTSLPGIFIELGSPMWMLYVVHGPLATP
ncbi:MAG: hypothetical protein IPP80_14395 [Ignavibacteria bacterium]|nr:hypothetical protein [Ignavibacteria bacterium]